MNKLNVWKQPQTGAVRVYISGFGQTKVWAEACATDTFGFDYTIKAINQNRSHSDLNNIINDAERTIFEAAGFRIKTFAEVLALAN